MQICFRFGVLIEGCLISRLCLGTFFVGFYHFRKLFSHKVADILSVGSLCITCGFRFIIWTWQVALVETVVMLAQNATNKADKVFLVKTSLSQLLFFPLGQALNCSSLLL